MDSTREEFQRKLQVTAGSFNVIQLAEGLTMYIDRTTLQKALKNCSSRLKLPESCAKTDELSTR